MATVEPATRAVPSEESTATDVDDVSGVHSFSSPSLPMPLAALLFPRVDARTLAETLNSLGHWPSTVVHLIVGFFPRARSDEAQDSDDEIGRYVCTIPDWSEAIKRLRVYSDEFTLLGRSWRLVVTVNQPGGWLGLYLAARDRFPPGRPARLRFQFTVRRQSYTLATDSDGVVRRDSEHTFRDYDEDRGFNDFFLCSHWRRYQRPDDTIEVMVALREQKAPDGYDSSIDRRAAATGAELTGFRALSGLVDGSIADLVGPIPSVLASAVYALYHAEPLRNAVLEAVLRTSTPTLSPIERRVRLTARELQAVFREFHATCSDVARDTCVDGGLISLDALRATFGGWDVDALSANEVVRYLLSSLVVDFGVTGEERNSNADGAAPDVASILTEQIATCIQSCREADFVVLEIERRYLSTLQSALIHEYLATGPVRDNFRSEPLELLDVCSEQEAAKIAKLPSTLIVSLKQHFYYDIPTVMDFTAIVDRSRLNSKVDGSSSSSSSSNSKDGDGANRGDKLATASSTSRVYELQSVITDSAGMPHRYACLARPTVGQTARWAPMCSGVADIDDGECKQRATVACVECVASTTGPGADDSRTRVLFCAECDVAAHLNHKLHHRTSLAVDARDRWHRYRAAADGFPASVSVYDYRLPNGSFDVQSVDSCQQMLRDVEKNSRVLVYVRRRSA